MIRSWKVKTNALRIDRNTTSTEQCQCDKMVVTWRPARHKCIRVIETIET